MLEHSIEPFYNHNSKILILGSFPSIKSREENFYYAHPQNRFWRVLSKVFEFDVPQSINDKKRLLLDNNIAIWDVIQSCDIVGSSDNSIKNVVPNNIRYIYDNCSFNLIVLNGRTAERYFVKYFDNNFNIPILCLPSTSPANATYTFEKLSEKWSCIRQYAF